MQTVITTVKKNTKYIFIFIILITSVASFFLGSTVEKNKYDKYLDTFSNLRENSDKYRYINPLIGGVSAPATDVGIYSDIKKDVINYLKKEELNGSLYSYSFYFRDMNTGFWFSDNESVNFSPASLFKLPIAIAIYKQIEDNPSFENTAIVYTEEISDFNSVKQLNAESALVIGRAYSVNELVKKTLVHSDNGAKNLLLSVLEKKYLDELLSLLSFTEVDINKTYEISSRKYANFLRILYGSTYINESHSEFILKLLAGSDFKKGLVAGIPMDVDVAHKFGTYEIEDKVNNKSVTTVQLHDCGIVYHKSKPYTFCLMTKGKDEASLFRVISNVSKMVYDYQELDSKE